MTKNSLGTARAMLFASLASAVAWSLFIGLLWMVIR